MRTPTVWLIRRDGPASAALMTGNLTVGTAEELAKLFGLEIVKEENEI